MTQTTSRPGFTSPATPARPRRGRACPLQKCPAARPNPPSPWSRWPVRSSADAAARRCCRSATGSVGGDTIAAALREAGADDRVSAVVLRVDSPGGSVTGSETIWREVARVRDDGKPVVASMGAVAASGGYYVSMGADAIVANPGTITGSIGVVTGKLVARDLKKRLGVGSDAVRTNANADAWSVNAPFTDEQRAQVEAEADLFYDDFVQRVAQGRNISVEDVDAVARGRVWTGADALEHGLVDELGGLRTAIARAKILAGLDVDEDARIVSYPGSSLMELLRPRPSSQPAAASLPEAVGALLGRSVAELLSHAQQTFTGTDGAAARRLPLLAGSHGVFGGRHAGAHHRRLVRCRGRAGPPAGGAGRNRRAHCAPARPSRRGPGRLPQDVACLGDVGGRSGRNIGARPIGAGRVGRPWRYRCARQQRRNPEAPCRDRADSRPRWRPSCGSTSSARCSSPWPCCHACWRAMRA